MLINVNDCSFAHLTLVLLLHYLVKYRRAKVKLWTAAVALLTLLCVSHALVTNSDLQYREWKLISHGNCYI